MTLGRLHRFASDFARRLGKRAVNSACVKPPDALFAENVIPIDVARLQLRSSRVTAIGAAERSAHAKAAFREIETVSYCASNAVERYPFDQRLIDASLVDQVLQQAANRIVDERSHYSGIQAKAF